MRIETNIRSIKDLSNMKFGRLIPIMPIAKDRFNKTIWLMLCDCGKTKAINSANLSSKHTQSCGCLRDECQSALKHGASCRGKITPEYQAFRAAKERCTNPKNKAYKYYGGRGIEFRFVSFEEFFAEIGLRPDAMSLDRIEVNGHYEKGNVRWATQSQQVQNRRSQPEILLQYAAALGGV
jgi:hypothetical protein